MNFRPLLDSRLLYTILFILLGYYSWQYHCQHQFLKEDIKTYNTNIELYDTHLTELMDHHHSAIHLCDSLINVIDSLENKRTQ